MMKWKVWDDWVCSIHGMDGSLCTVMEIAIFWDMMLCSRVDRCQFVSSLFMVVQEEPTVWLEIPNGRNYFVEVGTDGRKILKWILTLWSLEYGRFLECDAALSVDKHLYFRGTCCLLQQGFRRNNRLLATYFMGLKFHRNAQKGKAVWKGSSQTGEMPIWSFSLPRS